MSRFNFSVLLTLVLMTQGCTTSPQNSAGNGAADEPVPELELNLPGPVDEDCVAGEGADSNLLEKGFDALEAGEHIEAVRSFQSYQRLEGSPAAQWEAGIAIAYDSMLPQSPFYDPQAAVKSYAQLQKDIPEDARVHDKILLMHDSLAIFLAMRQQISGLQQDNKTLATDLEKREEALKRLRELALGQKGATP